MKQILICWYSSESTKRYCYEQNKVSNNPVTITHNGSIGRDHRTIYELY